MSSESDLAFDTLDLQPSGYAHVRWREAGGAYHRRAFAPGDDIDALPQAARAEVAALWTPQFVQDWKAANGVGQPPTLEALKAEKRAVLDAVYQARLAAGAPWDFGDAGAPDRQALQIATADDKANWMIFRGLCEEMLAAGQGDQPAAVPVRAASNDSFTVTAAQGVEITAAIRSHGAAALNRLWTLKDAIAAAPGAAALAAIDLAAGWPE